MGMTQEAVEARRDYKRQYRNENRDKINAQQREWRANNPDKVKQYNARYWEKKCRASWKELGITPERLEELQEAARSGKYDEVVLNAAHKADCLTAKYIILSVKKNLSYEGLQRLWELREIERMACCRTDFYGKRRLFFHYLDCALRGVEED